VAQIFPLLKQFYAEAVAFTESLVAFGHAGNLFTFASLASDFAVIVFLAAVDGAALPRNGSELGWVWKGMFWSVCASSC